MSKFPGVFWSSRFWRQGCRPNPQAGMPALRGNAGIPAREFTEFPSSGSAIALIKQVLPEPLCRAGIACALLGVTSACGEIQLPAIYSSDMVLQAGDETVIYGFATPRAKVTGFFRGKRFDYATAKAGGEWELKLNLRGVQDGVPAPLVLTEEVKDQPARSVKLDNVAVGRVWWIEVDPQRGIPASARAIGVIEPPAARDRIRYAQLAGGGWVSLARPDRGTNQLDAFALAAARHLVATNGFVGIVQTPPGFIAGFRPEESPRAAPGGVRSQMNAWLDTGRTFVNREVTNVRDANRRAQIADKHTNLAGPATTLALPELYVISTVRLRDDFTPPTPELKEFFRRHSFEGAIW